MNKTSLHPPLYRLLIAFALPFSTFISPLQAQLSVDPIFGDHMVLQRETIAPVYGRAAAGEKITIHLDGNEQTCTADESGNWRVELKGLRAGGPHELSVKGASKTITLTDVLIGEVWVGSGQSNMAGRVSAYAKNDATLSELLESAPYAKIRLLNGGPKPSWTEATEATVPQFSAILFAFGERLHRELDVPVGLMVGAVGGTPSGPWVSKRGYADSEECATALKKFKATYDPAKAERSYLAKLDRWEKLAAAAEAKGEKPKGRRPTPPVEPGEPSRGRNIGSLFERYIRSMVGYGIRGVLWDQGEGGTGIHGVDQKSMMTALINGWRSEWGQDFPFLFVQKPSGGGCAFDPANPVTRNAEPYKPLPESVPAPNPNGRLLYVRLMDVRDAYMVPACDLGSGIHPPNKWGYGNRAAQIALAKAYGQDLVAYGPTYESHKVEGDKIRVKFSHTGSGLTTAHSEKLTGFAVAGENGVFHWADATIDGESVILSSPEVSRPVHARYAAANSRPWANLFNEEGEPALAFSTDMD